MISGGFGQNGLTPVAKDEDRRANCSLILFLKPGITPFNHITVSQVEPDSHTAVKS